MNWLLVIAFCLVAYLIGAIPFSYVFAKWLRGIDLRKFGSGNLGSTNAMRALGAPLGITVQLLDILKGLLPVMILTPLTHSSPSVQNLLGGLNAPDSLAASVQYAGLAIGLSALLGHMFPVYLKCRGGKGVNTSLGVFFALTPKAIALSLAIGLALLAATRTVSVGSITGALILPFAVFYFYPNRVALVAAAAFVSILVIYMHRANIRRLLAGTELRIGQRKKMDEQHEHAPQR